MHMRWFDPRARVLFSIVGALLGCGGRTELDPASQAAFVREPASPTPASAAPRAPDAAVSAAGGAIGTSGGGNGGGEAGGGGNGTGGAAGAAAGSQGGTAGAFAPPRAPDASAAPAPPPDAATASPAPCDGTPSKPLPYAIAADFSYSLPLNAVQTWVDLTGSDCNQTVFPDVPDGGAAPDAGQPAVTSCYAYEYTPDGCVSANGGFAAGPDAGVDVVAACWAGVILTSSPFPQSALGICIAPGAMAIHFKARASRDGARVKFGAIRAGLGETEFFLEISREWQDYAITIPAGEPYDDEATSPLGGVWNGFSIVVEPEDHAGGTYIFVSDVAWSAS
jgi:hypothetical protein